MTTPAPITDEALAAIKAGLEGVTPGAWRTPGDSASALAIRLLEHRQMLEEALTDCAEWFKGYGDSHTAKGDIDKAQRNYDRERRARAALEGK